MTDLTTLTAVESYLSLDPNNPLTVGNSDEPVLSSLISACSAFFESVTGRSFGQATYSEIRDGKGAQVMFVRNPPIAAISSLTIGLETIPAGSQSIAGYLFDDRRIILRGYRFWKGLMNVAVTYTGGFAVIPDDLAQACIEQVALRYKERPHFDMSSKSMAGETTSFVMADMKASTKAVLDRYRRRTATMSDGLTVTIERSLGSAPPSGDARQGVRQALRRAVTVSAIDVQAKVQAKLAGPGAEGRHAPAARFNPLRGRGRRDRRFRHGRAPMWSTPRSMNSAGAWQIKEHLRKLTMVFGRPVETPREILVRAHIANYPERSFLRSTLTEETPAIKQRLVEAVTGALRE